MTYSMANRNVKKSKAIKAVKIMLNYYFNELRYNKVNVYIYES